MKKRVLALCLIVAMSAGLAVGCGSESGDDGAEKTDKAKKTENTEKVFNMPIGAMPEVLAPTDGTATAMTYLQAMYERLYCIDSEGEYTYFLADSCEGSEDALTYTRY